MCVTDRTRARAPNALRKVKYTFMAKKKNAISKS